MYAKIMVPVDLVHVERLDKALATAGDLARHYGVPIVYVGVAAATPNPVGHNPHEFETKLKAFTEEQAATRGVEASWRACITHDPAVDLDRTLLDAIAETGADLVVMASHVPGLAEHIFASNAGYVASHAKVSVLVVR